MSAADRDHLKIFAGRAGRELAQAMCDHLNLPVAEGCTDVFPDGELIVKVDEDVRGRDCYVVQSTSDPVNNNLMELLVFIDCLRRASAKRITAVIPYFGYARQDRKDVGRTPITAKLVANLITAAGADRVLCMDLHAAQIQGFFDIPVDHLSATQVFYEHFHSIRESLGNVVIVSPDVGNVKVANTYASLLDADLAIIEKTPRIRHEGFDQELDRRCPRSHGAHVRRHDLNGGHRLRGRQDGHGSRGQGRHRIRHACGAGWIGHGAAE